MLHPQNRHQCQRISAHGEYEAPVHDQSQNQHGEQQQHRQPAPTGQISLHFLHGIAHVGIGEPEQQRRKQRHPRIQRHRAHIGQQNSRITDQQPGSVYIPRLDPYQQIRRGLVQSKCLTHHGITHPAQMDQGHHRQQIHEPGLLPGANRLLLP